MEAPDEQPAKPDRQQRKEAKAAARRQRKEAKVAARREREEAKAVERTKHEEAQAAARKEKEEAQAAARQEREEDLAAARKKQEEDQAAARKEKEQGEMAARKAREEEAKARLTPEEDLTDRDENDRPETQALATATAAASATSRVEPDEGGDVATTERSPTNEERQIRADANSATRGDAEERKAARAAAAAVAEEKMRAKKEARKHRADAKKQARQAKAQAKHEAKQAKREARNRPKGRIDDYRAAQAEKVDAEFLKSSRESGSAATSIGGHASAVPAVSERALVEPAEATEATDISAVEEADKVEKVDEPSPTPISHDAGEHREPGHEETQSIGRVQVDDVPDAEPKEQRAGVRAAAIMVAALVGALGLICSVVLAVGALTVAIGAGEGNAIYDPLSTVCDALAGPLKNAFDFTGPNAASREEFLGWGAGSLIYLAVSFAGQAAHRAVKTRD